MNSISIDSIKELPEIKVLLNMLFLADNFAYNHSLKVAELAVGILNKTEEYTEEEKIEITKGALLHDIGKIFIPLNLSNYPYRFHSEELEIMKIHCCISYEIVSTAFSSIVQDICLLHHEKPNGTGYCTASNLIKLPKYVCLIQLCDIFEALTSERQYKQSYSVTCAIDLIKKQIDKLEIDDTYLPLLLEVINNKEC